MLCLLQARITKLPTRRSIKVVNLCIQMSPLNVVVQKEGWRVSQLKGKYAARLLILIQTIWLKGSCGTYVNKKFMLLVALAKLQILINWAQVVFNNLHSKLWDLSTTMKLKKKTLGRRQNLVQPRLSISSFKTSFWVIPLSKYRNLKTKMKRRITI